MLSAGLIPYIPFDRASASPFYTQVYDGLRTAILAGRLGPGERLPSTRALAAELRISRLPVLVAFEQLLHEGYLVGKVGSGTYIIDRIPDEVARPMPWRRRPRPAPPPQEVVPPVAPDTGIGGGHGLFRVGLPALDRFPHKRYAQLLRKHASNPCIDLLGYGDPAGYRPLREAIAEYLRCARAVECDASQVLIVSGSQMGLHIAASALTAPESVICVEEPGYPFAGNALAASGATIAPIPVDGDGIDVAAIRNLGSRARIAFVTPSHQFPLGMPLAVSRRRELLDWAEDNDSWIVEDDYDSEFRYGGSPLGSLQGMDTSGRVIYAGTFSKVMFPALRLGYLVVPPGLVRTFVGFRQTNDLFSPLLHQLALTDFLRAGDFARHLRRMRAVYLARRNALVDAVHDSAADVLTIANADVGLHLVAFLPDGVDDREVVRLAKQQGMLPWALSTCYAGAAKRNGLLLGFGGSDEASVALAMRDLGSLIRTLR